MDTYYIDGQYVDEDNCVLSVKDIIVLRGFGVFDFLITYNKRPFYLKEHVQRLETSAHKIGLKLRHSNDEICHIVEETIRRNPHHDESNIRIVYTGGTSSDGVTPEGNGYLIVMVTPKHMLPEWWYTDGAKLVTAEIERFIPGAKSTNYLTAVWALERAKAMDAIESIYVDRNNCLLEGTTTNFFCFKENKLVTPKLNILPGITRSVLVDLVKGHFDLEIREIQKDELSSMEEVFISASNKEIVPIIQVDDVVVANGRPGERTRKVMQLFKDYTTAYGQGKV
ncbi:MAG: aminotransferase class IV [Deltaproteobacteria bacterium]|jgi:branched-chain amino acid aminotransferase|nr:aminotransferase class IV [Deltaproteobacteria bacterium]